MFLTPLCRQKSPTALLNTAPGLQGSKSAMYNWVVDVCVARWGDHCVTEAHQSDTNGPRQHSDAGSGELWQARRDKQTARYREFHNLNPDSIIEYAPPRQSLYWIVCYFLPIRLQDCQIATLPWRHMQIVRVFDVLLASVFNCSFCCQTKFYLQDIISRHLLALFILIYFVFFNFFLLFHACMCVCHMF